MERPAEIYVGSDAVNRLVQFCTALPERRMTIVADTNTYAALGERVERALASAGLDVLSIVLRGAEIAADEKHLVEVLVQSPPVAQTFIAVGSGTITDIARYVSFRTGNPFISVPTAASVDGFVSVGAPLVVGGLKDTYSAQGPVALFGDLTTLIEAPHELTAAGFGDIAGKATSLADWMLGRLLWDEPFSPEIEQRTRRTLEDCISRADEIQAGTEQGIRSLIEGLIESGMCILDFGNSRPASGSEHHCSHYWEMQLLRAHRPAILHGAKVGYASILIAQLYARLRELSQDDAARLLRQTPNPTRAAQTEEIRAAYGAAAEGILRIQQPFLDLTDDDYARLKQRIIDNWAAIRDIAATVAPPETLKQVLDRVEAPTSWRTLGLEEDQVEPGLLYGHYLRNRFTVVKLFRLLGIPVNSAIAYA